MENNDVLDRGLAFVGDTNLTSVEIVWNQFDIDFAEPVPFAEEGEEGDFETGDRFKSLQDLVTAISEAKPRMVQLVNGKDVLILYMDPAAIRNPYYPGKIYWIGDDDDDYAGLILGGV